MGKIFEFDTQQKVGLLGEEEFQRFTSLEFEKGHIVSAENLSKNREFFTQDIDFVWVYPGGNIRTWEVKTDTTQTGNIFFETAIEEENNNKPGWGYSSQAGVIFYYFLKVQEVLIFNLQKVKDWVGQRTFKSASAMNISRGPNPHYYKGVGLLVPLKEILNAPELRHHVCYINLHEGATQNV